MDVQIAIFDDDGLRSRQNEAQGSAGIDLKILLFDDANRLIIRKRVRLAHEISRRIDCFRRERRS